MADRLEELRRQRALLQQHLDWLDAEIAQVEPGAKPPESPRVSLAPAPAAPLGRPLPADAEAILSQYRSDPGHVRQDVRKGCLLYFAGAMLLLGLGVAGLYLLLRREDPVPPPPGPEMSRPVR